VGRAWTAAAVDDQLVVGFLKVAAANGDSTARLPPPVSNQPHTPQPNPKPELDLPGGSAKRRRRPAGGSKRKTRGMLADSKIPKTFAKLLEDVRACSLARLAWVGLGWLGMWSSLGFSWGWVGGGLGTEVAVHRSCSRTHKNIKTVAAVWPGPDSLPPPPLPAPPLTPSQSNPTRPTTIPTEWHRGPASGRPHLPHRRSGAHQALRTAQVLHRVRLRVPVSVLAWVDADWLLCWLVGWVWVLRLLHCHSILNSQPSHLPRPHSFISSLPPSQLHQPLVTPALAADPGSAASAATWCTPRRAA